MSLRKHIELRLIFIVIVLVTTNLNSQSIVLDEDVNDWQSSMLISEDLNDGQTIDIRNLYISNDDNSLFLRFEFAREMLLQADNGIILYLDYDNDISTGFRVADIGVDLSFNFGFKTGIINTINTINVSHSDIGLVSSPTVTSDVFEVSLNRVLNIGDLRMGNEIKLYLSTGGSSADFIPNQDEAVVYKMRNNVSPQYADYDLLKNDEDAVRVLSYNVLRDNIFETSTAQTYQRLLSNIDADIMCFQEIYDNDESDLLEYLNSIDAINTSQQYYDAVKGGRDLITVSKYPIKYHSEVDGNSFVVIDKDGEDMIIFNCHLPCCDNDDGREGEIDQLLAFLRTGLEGNGDYPILSGTPYMILGDMNFVGNASQVNSLETGNILNNSWYGPDFVMDWDGSGLKDLKPQTTQETSSYTWYNPQSSFSAGRLDYILYTDAVLDPINSYVLNTTKLTIDELQESGFNAADISIASDHLPIIADFKTLLIPTSELIQNEDILIYPNPTFDIIKIKLEQDIRSIQFVDFNGKIVYYSDQVEKNTIQIPSKINSGVYTIIIETEQGFSTNKVVVQK